MARKKINLNNIKEQVLEEELVVNHDENMIEPMSPVGGPSSETSAVKPKRKGLMFLTLILVFIVMLSVVLKMILPQGTPIPSINIKFDCIANVNLSVTGDSGFIDRKIFLPGDTLDATVVFTLSQNEDGSTDLTLNNQVFVKTRIYGKLDDEYFPNMFGYELDGNWVKSINGYYYFNKILALGPNGEKTEEYFQTKISIEKSVGNEFQGKTVDLVIEFTILQAEYEAINDVWKDAPYDWRVDMFNKYFAEN